MMTHFQKPSILKWVSFYFVENQLKTPFLGKGPLHNAQRQNPRLYRTKTSVPRVHQPTLKVAQAALLDYLHATRGIDFADAESISGNSPHFMIKLLKKVGDDPEDIRSSVSRFFRYHPINEFEPFFESLGLKPCEYTPLLPRDLMFLSDDSLLLENYKVLCECGIERNKIGKIYKEAIQVFRYEVGVLPSKLRAYEEMGISRSFLAKAIVCSPRLLVGDVDMKFVKVLEILRSLGFDYAWIEEQLSEEESYNWSMMFRVLNFFSAFGCSSELHGQLSQRPGILFEDSGDQLLSLIAVLLKFGYPMDQIASLFLQFPEIQVRQFVSNFVRCFLFFNEIEMEVHEIGKILCSYPLLLGSIVLKKTNSLLNILNVGKKRLCKYIQENPQELSKWIMGSKVKPLPDSGEDIMSQELRTKFLLELGYGEDPNMMKKALKVFRGKGGELQERFDCIVNAGFDRKDVSKMVRLSPHILNQSKDFIQTKIDVLVNELGYPLSALLAFPSYLCYTTQRVRLRLAMYYWLKDQGKADPDLALSTLVSTSDKKFLQQYVNNHPGGPQVWEELKSKFSLDK